MIVLGLDARPRKSEIAALALTGLDLADWPGALAITAATGSTRTVPLQPGTRAALVAWLAERRRLLRDHPERVALFLTEQVPHRRLAVRAVDDDAVRAVDDDAVRAVDDVGADAGVDVSPGTLRATAEQRMLREGLPPAVVAARLGQQAPDRDRVRALLGDAAARPRNRLALNGSEHQPYTESRGRYWDLAVTEPPTSAGISRCFAALSKAIARRGAIADSIRPVSLRWKHDNVADLILRYEDTGRCYQLETIVPTDSDLDNGNYLLPAHFGTGLPVKLSSPEQYAAGAIAHLRDMGANEIPNQGQVTTCP
ncbi:tyrosine-type recombinase/integrase [Nocardia sp. NPDC047038]|uniref:tyrosine-type recombinase/integrase n=1 Tax=Nocardia sp. NPDC047038 TaxID=3154338 RepID=UPI0033F38047